MIKIKKFSVPSKHEHTKDKILGCKVHKLPCPRELSDKFKSISNVHVEN